MAMNAARAQLALSILGQINANNQQQSSGGGGGGYITDPVYGAGGAAPHGGSFGSHLWGALGNVLGTPLAAVTSAVKESGQGLDHLFGQARPGEGNFSWSDLGNQIIHPQDRVSTNDILFGNKARNMGDTPYTHAVTNPLQRAAIGLGTSIAVDPLTYVGGIGEGAPKDLAEEVATQTVKRATAAAAVHAGLDALPGSIDEQGALLSKFTHESDVAKILSEGQAATAEARRVGIAGKSVADFLASGDEAPTAARGLGFKGHLIPGTDSAPATAVGDAFAGTKAAIADKFLASPLSGLVNTDRELTLAARSGNPQEAFDAVMTKLAKGGAGAERSGLGATLATQYHNIVGGLSEEDKALAYRIAGGDAMAAADAPKNVTEAAQGIRKFYNDVHDQATEAGVKLGTAENYLPRTMTPADREILQEAGVSPKGAGSKFMSGAHFFAEQARKLVPDENGNYTFLGHTFQAPNGEADVRTAMTQIAHDAVAAKDPQLAEQLGGFFNPNHDASAAQYINGVSGRIAQANAAKRLFAAGIGDTGNVAAHALEDTATAPKALMPAADGARFVGGTETTLAPHAANIQTAMQDLAGRVDDFQGARQGVKDALAGGDTVGAREALGTALHSAIGGGGTVEDAQNDAMRVEKLVGQHFPEGPGGVPFADTGAINKTLGNVFGAMKQHGMDLNDELQAAKTAQPTIVDRLAGDARVADPGAPVAATPRSTAQAALGQDARAVQLVKEAPEQTQQRISSLQGELHTVQHSIDSGSVEATATQQRDLSEYMLARQEQIGSATARLNATDIADKHSAALAESAAELRAQIASNGQGLAKQAITYGDMPERQLQAVAALVKAGAARELSSGIGTPVQVADWLNFATRLSDPQELRGIFKGWDHVVQTLRNYEMLYPGFFPKIAIGHYLNNLPAGVEASDYVGMLKLLAKDSRGTLTDDESELLSNIRSATGRGQVSGTYDNPRDAMEALLGKPTSGTWNPASPRFKAFNASRAAGDKITEVLRGALAHHVLEDGGTVDQAISKIAHYQFDYTDLTPAEQALRRHLVPFYTFTRNNLPLQVEQLMRNPKYMERFFLAKQSIEGLSSPDKNVPGYFNSAFNIRLPWQLHGGATYFTPEMPQQDLAKFINTPSQVANNALGMVSPLVKTPIEDRLGKTFQEQIPLSTSKFVPVPTPIKMVPWLSSALDRLGVFHAQGGQQYMNYRDAYVMEQALPMISRWRRLMPAEASYQDRRLTSLLSFLGIPVSANTALQQAGNAKGQKAAKTLNTTRNHGLQKAVLAYDTMQDG